MDMAVLQTRIAQNRKAASGVRLTHKVREEEPLPVRTRDFLKLHETSRKKADTAKSSTQILFKTSILLQKPAGQKQGTRVPVQSRGFPLEDRMDRVLKAMVNLVLEASGQWVKNYLGKTFDVNDVQFTFATGGMEIPPAYRKDCTVAHFWNTFARCEGQYFKKASINTFTADIVMLIPIELTLVVLNNPEKQEPESEVKQDDWMDEILMGKRRRSGKSTNNKPAKKRKVKEEDLDVPIKAEPMETKYP
ncbi:hypothetical protein C8R46DRAFT_1040905 [Mycena filopes]|nr:hypothetical protein C8R46DRAFT_1040905 [Mycena filopes]